MKKNKLFTALAAFTMVSGAAFAETEFSVSNEVSSDIVNIEKVEDDSDTSFAGIENKTSFEFTSEKVDAFLELSFWSDKATEGDDDYFAIGTGGFDFGDSYIEIRPFEHVGFEFHEKIFTAGSYLPVWDDNASTGNIGSDFGLVIRPVDGLIIGGGLDFVSKVAHDDENPIVNFGLEYASEDFAVGGAVRNVAGENDFSFGVFASILSVENLTLNFGFAYNDAVEPDVGTVEGNLLTFGGSYEQDAFHSAWDFATNFTDSDDQEYDFYIAAALGYNFTENFSADCAFATVLDGESDDDKKADERFNVNPSITYTVGNREFGAGVNIFFGENYSLVSFPVYWEYSF